MKRLLIVLLLMCTLCACSEETPVETVPETTFASMAQETTVPEATAPAKTAPEETEPEIRSYTLTFAGDCTFGASPAVYYAQMGFPKTVGDDFGYPFRNVIDYFANDDFSMVNLEGPLGEVGSPIPKKHNFRGPVKYAKILVDNSIEAVTIANNHTLDYGPACYASTVQTLAEAGVPFVERDASAVVTLEDGLKIGLYATSYEHVDAEKLVTGISSLKTQGVDLIIYAAHWGVEGSYRPHISQTELGHMAIDAGANIVFGSHPHVLQPIEEYGGGVIYYSLGNFSFGGNTAPRDYDTAIVQQEILVNGTGTVTLGERTVVPCSVSSVANFNNYQPTSYEPGSPEYERVLEKLSGTYRGANLPIG